MRAVDIGKGRGEEVQEERRGEKGKGRKTKIEAKAREEVENK